ncbi:hypothetical protein ACVMDN_004147 [Bradyrhizobium sp. USDA 4510]
MGATKVSAIAIGLAGALAASPAYSQSAGGGSDAEIALLKQQLKMLEQKLDKLQKQTNANTASAASANANAKAADAKAARVATANAAIPVKGPVAPSGVVVTMPNNRPTICTADEQNCVAITSRVHWDVGGYDYRPNTAGTSPQKLDSGENVRRARIGIVGKFFGDWNYSLIYDFGGSSDGFGGAAPGSLPGARHLGHRERVSELHRLQAVRRQDGDRRRHHGRAVDTRRSDQLQRHPVHGARLGRHHRTEHRRR